MSKIKKLVDDFDWHYIQTIFNDIEEEIVVLACTSEDEKNVLLDMFLQEKNEHTKLFIADILAHAHCKEIEPFLLDIFFLSTSHMDKLRAISILIMIECPFAREAIKQLVPIKKLPRHWFINDLEEMNTPYSQSILKELVDEFPDIAAEYHTTEPRAWIGKNDTIEYKNVKPENQTPKDI